MEKEDLAFRAYLEENGFDTSKMGLLDQLPASEIIDEKEKEDSLKAEVKAEEV